MTDQTTDRHTCHNQKAAAGPAWQCARCSAAPAVPLPPVVQSPIREQLLNAIDFSYCQTLGYSTPEGLLAAYEASRTQTVDQAALRETAEAVLAAVETALCDELVPSARAEALAGIAAVLPATTNHDTDTGGELASLAVNAGRALQDEKRHYEIACRENTRLRAELESERDASRRLLAQRQEMAEERYAWQQRGDRAEAEVNRLRTMYNASEARVSDLIDERDQLLEKHADRRAVLREAADIAEAQRQFEPAYGARKSAQVSENVGILRVAAELRRVADETAATETQAADALSELEAAARALELDRDAASTGESRDYRRGMTRAVQVLRLLDSPEPAANCSCGVLRTGPGRHLPECPNRAAAGARQDGAQPS